MPAHQVKLWSDNNFAIEHYSFVMLSHFAAAESRKTRHARPCAGHPRLSFRGREDVDGRDKPGHDERGCVAVASRPLPPIRKDLVIRFRRQRNAKGGIMAA